MAAQDFDLASPKGVCAKTGRVLAEGEEFYTVLYAEEDGFRRVDLSREAWEGPPDGAFCCFKTRVPVRRKRAKLLVDNDLLVSFFRRLEGETEPARVQFRFVLGLLLIRKRLLRYEGSTVRDDAETWRLTMPADHSTHTLVNPKLSEDEIEGVSQQLTSILHTDVVDTLSDTGAEAES